MPNNEAVKLNKMLQHLCKEKNLSLSKLSRMADVPKPTLHGWMTGRKAMDLTQLKRVASALKISLHELAFGEPDPFEGTQDEILKEIFSGDVRVTLHRIEKNKKQTK